MIRNIAIVAALVAVVFGGTMTVLAQSGGGGVVRAWRFASGRALATRRATS